jgi:hypothetical protein
MNSPSRDHAPATCRGDAQERATETMAGLPCIVCGRDLASCSRPNQPLDGLAFSSRGHYGTTVFDPMDGSALEINVCDPCLVSAGERRRVLRYPAQTPSPGFHATAILWGTNAEDEATARERSEHLSGKDDA